MLRVRAGWHEELSLLAPVAEVRLEDVLEEPPVLLRKRRHVGPEGPANEVLSRPAGSSHFRRYLNRGREVKAVQSKVHALGHARCANGKLWHSATGRDHASRERWDTGGSHLRRRSTANPPWRKSQVGASINRVHLSGEATLRSHDLAIGNVDLSSPVLIPQLRDLLARERLLGPLECHPRVVQLRLVLHKELGEASCLGQLAEMVDGALPLRNEVEEVREGLCVLDQRMVVPGNGHVLVAIGALANLASLDAELHLRDDHVVLSHLNRSLLHHEPLSANPLLQEALLFRELVAVLHARNGLDVVTKRELLEVIVRLEEDLAHAGAGEPLGLKRLDLPEVLLSSVGAKILGVQ
mmetsp:Transcript_4381/g.9813  ORF Transcript_4381/g.9813 Transcript_4381/m.9813 type:complete len:353 (+) Transcript_4381:1080-2138(+)